MKRAIPMFVSLLLVAALAACSHTAPSSSAAAQSSQAVSSAAPAPSSQSASTPVESQAPAEEPSGTILVAYFTMPEPTGVDTVAGASRVVVDGEVLGNTQLVAQWIAEDVDGDLFAIETVQTYPADHDELTEAADEEQANAARPELSTQIENLDAYDTIFIGYPNWWADMPMPMYTFFEEYDFSGKTIIPFNTHGGSGFSNSINTIASLQPNATVVQNGFTVSRNSVAGAQSDVLAWLEEVGY